MRTSAIVLLLAVAIPVAFRFYDYNRFISVPYWFTFSFCYLFPSSDFSMCTPESLAAIIEWTKNNWNWDLEEHKPGEMVAIPELKREDFSYKELDRLSKGFTIPVIVRGLFANTQANQKWTHEYFEENYGENILITLQEGRTDKQYRSASMVKSVTGNGNGTGKGYQNIMKPVKMKIKNALKYMREGEKLYLSNVDTIFRRNNDLLDDLEFSRVVNWAYNPYVPYAAQIFLGYGAKDINDTTGTMMHCAASANLFIQVKGTKNWIFIHPRYSVFISPSLGAITPAAKAGKKPLNAGTPVMHVTLKEGDMLFNPPWMWHEIKNHEGFNIGIATRENHPTWIIRNNWLFSALLEVYATPRIAKVMIPANQKAFRMMASVPYLTFMIGLVTEIVKGPGPHPIFTAGMNPCDEHDPKGCSSTFLDKSVYSDDVEAIPYRE
jgi:hypothetical protein